MIKKKLGNKTKLILTKGVTTPWVAKITGLEDDYTLKREFLEACHINNADLHFLCDEGFYEFKESLRGFVKVLPDGSWKNSEYREVKDELMFSL